MTTVLLEPPVAGSILTRERRELVCGACGYGAPVREEPPDCPMCRASLWLERERGVPALA